MAPVDPPPTRIFLRPLGSPLPLALAGLAIASLLTTGLDWSWVPVGESRQVGLLILVAVVPIQLIACAVAYPTRDGATASAIGVLAAGWGAYGLIRATSAPGLTSSALGLVLLMVAGVLAGAGASQAVGKLLPGLVTLLAAARFACAGVYELTASSGWQNAAGAVGIAVAAGALYLVWALELEDARDHTVLPVLRQGGGRREDGLAHEPGVRAQL
jgi:succinate-acetate transporter protein